MTSWITYTLALIGLLVVLPAVFVVIVVGCETLGILITGKVPPDA